MLIVVLCESQHYSEYEFLAPLKSQQGKQVYVKRVREIEIEGGGRGRGGGEREREIWK